MNRPGDWTCRSCHRMNFQRRDLCQRCGEPRPLERGSDYLGSFGGRPASTPPSHFGLTGPDVRPGDWYCAIGNCGTHNFANRTTCFRCGAFREDANEGGMIDSEVQRLRGLTLGGGGSSRRGWRAGDWICPR